jgi:hypothetical protein
MTLIPVIQLMTTRESPQQQQEEESQKKHRETCHTILALSPKIRYVGIMNKFGRTLVAQLRKGVLPLFRVDEARNEFFVEAIRNQLRKNFESSIGKTEYSFTENEKVKILTLSNETNLYYITLDKDTDIQDFSKIIESVKKIVRPINS